MAVIYMNLVVILEPQRDFCTAFACQASQKYTKADCRRVTQAI